MPTSVSSAVVDLDARRPNDTSEQRAIVLDNGLEALLISDPSLQKSAAALDVAVGSMEDPESRQGLAHFLEHMLFLGTERFPDPQEYKRLLAQYQGSGNAYTTSDHTNYQFEVNHEGFEPVLERFAQFFVSPLFTEELTERELNAVFSEHQKNLQNDDRRSMMVEWMLHRPGHPRCKFPTGDESTLGGVSRQELLDFYRPQYSADVMKLCVLSTKDLDSLEQLVRSQFGGVRNNGRGEHHYSGDIFPAEALPDLVQIRPLSDQRRLKLVFGLPPTIKFWRAKPGRLLISLIGHEGAGSLLSKLKEENLATELGASLHNTSWSGYFEVRISLTADGQSHLARVFELFFAYVEMLRREGLKRSFFDEEKTLFDLDYFFRDHQEGMWVAAHHAAEIQDYPALEAERRGALLLDYDPQLFQRYLEKLRPSTMRAILMAADVPVDQVEPHYGTEFGRRPLTGAERAAAERGESGADRGVFHYLDPNPFVPSDLTLLQSDPHDAPYLLLDDERGVVWFEQDRRFNLPKAHLLLLLHSPEMVRSTRSAVVATLYADALNESLREWNYMVRMAGLRLQIDYDERGLLLQLEGYSQKIPELLRDLAPRLEEITIGERSFAELKETMRRDLSNVAHRVAFQQVLGEFHWLVSPYAIHYRETEPLIEDVTLEEVREFARGALRNTALEGAAYGNLQGEELQRSLEDLFAAVSGGILASGLRKAPRAELVFPAEKAWAHCFATANDNNCWLLLAPIGAASPRSEALARLGATLLKAPFFAEMRTRQQLGYVVFCGAMVERRSDLLYFLIQSGDYSAVEMRTRADAWLREFVPALADMDGARFAQVKAGLIVDLEQEETDMRARLRTLDYEGLVLEGDFHHRQRVVAALKELSLQETVEVLERCLTDGRGGSLSFYYDAEGQAASVPPERRIVDPVEFKRSLPQRP
jgi:insulysin